MSKIVCKKLQKTLNADGDIIQLETWESLTHDYLTDKDVWYEGAPLSFDLMPSQREAALNAGEKTEYTQIEVDVLYKKKVEQKKARTQKTTINAAYEDDILEVGVKQANENWGISIGVMKDE